MKLKKLLSFAAAAVMTITSLTGAMTITASAGDNDVVVLPDRGSWSQISTANNTQLKIMNYPTDNKLISSLEGKNDIYVTFRVSGVTAKVKAYLALWTKAGTTLSIWDSSDEKSNTAGVTNPFTEITKDGTYTAKLHSDTAFTADTTFDFLAVVFKSSMKNASLQSVTSEDPIKATYDVSENGDGSVTATVYKDGTFLVSGTGATKNYGLTGSENPYLGPWYSNGSSQNIKSIVVEKGVTSIGTYLLASFKNATSASIPSTVTSIGQGAFSQDNALKEVKITDKTTINKLTSIGKYAFQYCESLETLDEYILSGVTEIPENCFYYCESLKSVSISDDVTSIGDGAFKHCSLESVTLPESVTYIGDRAFELCPLTSVKIPDAVTYIGDFAFNGADTFLDTSCLASVEISDTSKLKTIGNNAFQNAVITSINLPEGLETIGEYAFCGCPITSLDLPSTVTSIGRQAFRNCKLTGDVIIPEGVTSLNANIFLNNTSNDLNIYVKGQITSVGLDPFGYCAGKIYVYDKNTYDLINDETSYGTAELILDIVTYDVSVNGDGSVIATLLPNGSLVISGTGAMVTTRPWDSDGNGEKITSLIVEDGVTNVAFKGTAAVESVTLAESVKTIERSAFNGCSNPDLTIDIKGSDVYCSVPSFGTKVTGTINVYDTGTYSDVKNRATKANVVFNGELTGKCGENVNWKFDEDTGVLTISGTGPMYEENYMKNSSWSYSSFIEGKLKEIVVEEGVTSIGQCAFSNGRDSAENIYPTLTKVTLPSTIETISNYAFKNLNVDIAIPDNVSFIGQNAFSNTSITSVNLKSGETVGTAAFGACNSLTEVTIPAGLIYIKGDGGNRPAENVAFSDCTSLEKVTILGGGTDQNKSVDNALSQGMFIGCTALKEVIVDCKDLAFVYGATAADATFPINDGMTFKVYKGSTTEKTLRDAGYITDDNVVYLVDYTELSAKIAEAEAIDADNYTAESYAVLTSAIATAKTLKENADATQDDVDSAVKAITDAIVALKAVDVNEIKASLESLTEKIEKLLTVKEESNYTTDSWTALDNALTAAKGALASETTLTYKEYKALYDNLNAAYSGLAIVSTADSEYVGTIYGGYEVTYNHETDSYKVVVSDDVDMDSVVGTTYVKVKCTPNDELKYQLSYGTLHIWNFLDNDQSYTKLNGSADNVFIYNLSIPNAESAFSLTAGTGWTKETEVFYVKSVEFYNANDELLYTYSADSIGTGDVRNLKTAIEKAEAIDKSVYTEESAELLASVLEEAKAALNNTSATKDDYRVLTSELEAAIVALEYLPADYTKVNEAIAKVPADLSVYTDETAKAVTDAVAAVVEDKNITEQSEVDSWAKAIEDAIAGLKLNGGNVTGTIKVSDKDDSTEMTVKAVAADGTETAVTATSMGEYVIENLEVGDYTLEISGGKYATRTYEITVAEGGITQDVELNPWGDINGDGDVTTADVGMANSHAKGVNTLEGYKFVCANVSDKAGAEVTTADVGMINSHAKGVKALW